MSQPPIRTLPSAVADAIAAGEVVERPAAVVKELIENSLDANAGRVTVEIRGAGRTLIRVVDDGPGIPAAELRLAFQRHATSKLTGIEDLRAIATLGFRGEALASIAAVSDLEAVSAGARIRIRAGAVVEEGAAGPAPGLVIEVRDLFGNTPARLKFMKSDATEAAACVRLVQHYSLLYPEVRFKASLDGRTVLATDGRDPVQSVHGPAVARELLAVDREGVRGLVSPPRLSRGNRDGILLAVNGRPISSRSLSYALDECYRGTLERGRFPVAILDLEVDPAAVDVNVHPSKREVKFREEGAVFAALQRAVREALNGAEAPRLPVALASATYSPSPAAQLPFTPNRPLPSSGEGTEPRSGAVLRPIGQVQDGYLVAEGTDGLVLIDQHAAHERVLFNRFRARLDAGEGPSQVLLLPITVDLEPAQVATLAERRAALRSLGFDVEAFGPRTARILAAPAETPPTRIEPALREFLDGLHKQSVEDALAGLACHSAVRFGDALDPSEQRRLLQELESTTPDATCPHGRPTRLLLDWKDLKRHFRRNY